MKLYAMNAEYQRQSELPEMDEFDFDSRLGMLVDAPWLSRRDARFQRFFIYCRSTRTFR